MTKEKPTPKRGLSRIINAIFYSFSGIVNAFRSEEAFRQEVVLACILVPVALLIPATPSMKLLLLLAMFLVLLTELLNTAIETIVDHILPDFHESAKLAKDLGSAAVFISFVALILAWGFAVIALVNP